MGCGKCEFEKYDEAVPVVPAPVFSLTDRESGGGESYGSIQ
jgi:hypothetical protein